MYNRFALLEKFGTSYLFTLPKIFTHFTEVLAMYFFNNNNKHLQINNTGGKNSKTKQGFLQPTRKDIKKTCHTIKIYPCIYIITVIWREKFKHKTMHQSRNKTCLENSIGHNEVFYTQVKELSMFMKTENYWFCGKLSNKHFSVYDLPL